ncbi:hypothetical protein Taro_003413 [Colocasia esculenta]|uniref:Replication factor A C-terminal domain-containing protein n=1 Tax=Colocasia esculenta TaxID=4460 RepID=A0A843TNJ5_COLES|nr:hypothetical protein [Colocasia esculenta]
MKIETEYNWFYNSCNKCRRKVKPDGGKFWCDKCSFFVNFVVPRYKVQLRVIDHTGSASFLLFDREANQILNKTAINLRDKLIKDGDTESFPEELDNFLQKKFIFKIQITEFNLQQKWPIYTVVRVTDDNSLIEEYLSSSIESNENLELDESIKQGEQITDVDTSLFFLLSASSLAPSRGASLLCRWLRRSWRRSCSLTWMSPLFTWISPRHAAHLRAVRRAACPPSSKSGEATLPRPIFNRRIPTPLQQPVHPPGASSTTSQTCLPFVSFLGDVSVDYPEGPPDAVLELLQRGRRDCVDDQWGHAGLLPYVPCRRQMRKPRPSTRSGHQRR